MTTLTSMAKITDLAICPPKFRWANRFSCSRSRVDLIEKGGEGELEAVQVKQETSDPRVGEKRPREEDESDAQDVPLPIQSYVVKQEPPTGPRMSSGPIVGSDVLNGTMQSNSAMSQSQMLEDGYDSLYIGDLQWVRNYLVLEEVYADHPFV
jgi:hypothetical protein